MAKFKLYEVVARKNSAKPFPLFCPTAVKVRLALLQKGIKPSDIATVDVTYHDLRFIWKEKLGVEQATSECSFSLDCWAAGKLRRKRER